MGWENVCCTKQGSSQLGDRVNLLPVDATAADASIKYIVNLIDTPLLSILFVKLDSAPSQIGSVSV